MTQNRGFTLIGTLVTLAIMAMLAVFVVRYVTGGGGAGDGRSGGKALTPTARAKVTVRNEYIGQIKQAIAMYKMDHEDGFPRGLADLHVYGVTDAMVIDPNTKRPLFYDPQTGEVSQSSSGQ